MKSQLIMLALLASSKLMAQELILSDDRSQSVLSKIMNCQTKLTAISTAQENASLLVLKNSRSQGVLILDNNSENFGSSIGDGNYYLRFVDSGSFEATESEYGIFDQAKIDAMLENYKKTKKLSSDIYLSDEAIKALKINAVHTFQLVQNTKLGAEYSDDGLDEGIRIKIALDPIAYKNESIKALNILINEINNSKSHSMNSHMGDLTGLLLVDLLASAPKSSQVSALEKLDTILPVCK